MDNSLPTQPIVPASPNPPTAPVEPPSPPQPVVDQLGDASAFPAAPEPQPQTEPQPQPQPQPWQPPSAAMPPMPTPATTDTAGSMPPVAPPAAPITPPTAPVSPVDGSAPKGKSKFILFAVLGFVLLLALGVGAYYYLSMQNNQTSSSMPGAAVSPSIEPVVCTMDAKVCPDGSTVGRVGPNCEFAECPVAEMTTPTEALAGNTAVTTQMGFTMTLPETMQVVTETPDKIEIGTVDPVRVYLTVSQANTVDPTAISKCAIGGTYPCMEDGTMRGQASEVEATTVAGQSAQSFYMSSSPDAVEHVVQVTGRFEARMVVGEPGSDEQFASILNSIVFNQ
jgi:hypothetical protein